MKVFAVIVVVTLLMFEAAAFLLDRLDIIIPEESRTSYFRKLQIVDPELGWDVNKDNNGKRPNDLTFEKVCYAAFGDSFTYSDEVPNDKTWAYLLSKKLQCRVENFGVGGYGQDQSLLKFQKHLHELKGIKVIVGIYHQTLKRNLAASWLFYANEKKPRMKPYFENNNGSLVLNAIPKSGAISELISHHKHDRFYEVHRFEFPYTISTIRIIYYGLSEDKVAKIRLEPVTSVYTDEETIEIQNLILKEFVKKMGRNVIFFFFPHANEIKIDLRTYRDYKARLQREFPDNCVLDPFDHLRKWYAAYEKTLQAEKGHFNDKGNALLAEYAFAALKQCDK